MKRALSFSYTRIIALGFFVTILAGSLLLSLPVASRSGTGADYITALFTATSATCVTGLSVVDTYTQWSQFGQWVLLVLIQIGGLGFMTVITLFSMLLRRQIGLRERKLLMQSAGSITLSGVVRLIRRVALGTLLFEGVGTVLLAFRFCRDMGFWDGLFSALFHAVSAFCNAGFDVLGRYAPGSSLALYATDPLVILPIVFLILVGGLGFFVWNDLIACRGRFRALQLHSKLVLMTTGVLVLGGAVLFYLFERGGSLAGMNAGESIMTSLFYSVTPRTAGFAVNTMQDMSESGNLLTMILMLIGGSPGSTAGGIKTTTLVVLVMAAVASARHTPQITVCKRRLEDKAVQQAVSITVIYLAMVLVSTMLLCALQPFTMEQAMYEVISAVGTVGLSSGITASLNTLPKCVVMLLMYAGRVGGLTLALVLAERRNVAPVDRPVDKIMIG